MRRVLPHEGKCRNGESEKKKKNVSTLLLSLRPPSPDIQAENSLRTIDVTEGEVTEQDDSRLTLHVSPKPSRSLGVLRGARHQEFFPAFLLPEL